MFKVGSFAQIPLSFEGSKGSFFTTIFKLNFFGAWCKASITKVDHNFYTVCKSVQKHTIGLKNA